MWHGSGTSSVDIRHRLFPWLITGILLWGPALGHGQSSRLTRDDIALIKTAESPEDLVDLARQFILQEKRAAAMFCIEKACEAQPDLLTDDTLDASGAWNAVWFSERAKIRLEQLDEDDVEGRLEIARWLHRAGVEDEARDLLEEVLTLDEDHPGAQALARQWQLNDGPPVRFDLRLGLTEPLLRDSIQDEGQTDEARRGRQYLLVPFQYEPRERGLNFGRNDLKATFDDGSSASSKGILLLERTSTRHVRGTPAAGTSLSLQGPSEPLWERVTATPPDRGAPRPSAIPGDAEEATYPLTCFNTSRPRTGDRTSGASGRSRTTSDRGQSRLERTGTGFAAYVLEVPEDMTRVECTLDDRITIQLDRRFLIALSASAPDAAADAMRDDALAEEMMAYASSQDGEVARVALLRLAVIHERLTGEAESSSTRRSPDEPPAPISPLLERIDHAIIQAIAHPYAAAARVAFTSIVDTKTTLHPEMVRFVAQSDPEIGGIVLDQINALLVDRPPGSPSPDPRRAGHRPGDPGSPVDMVAGLPLSPAPPNVFEILSACLSSPHAALREKALRICLQDGSQQSIGILNQLRGQSSEILLKEMDRVTDPQLKGTILRVLVLSAEEEALPALLQATEGLTLQVRSGNDPLLTRLKRLQTQEAAVPLLALLTRARFDEDVARSPELLQAVRDIPEPLWQVPHVQAELYKLCAFPLRPEYASPIKYEKSGSPLRSTGQETQPDSAFEEVLTRLTLQPESFSKVVEASILQLIGTGRIEWLNQGLARETTPADRRITIIRQIAKEDNQQLWTLDATPVFLASRVGDPDDEAVRLALSYLLDITRRLDEDDAWRFHFAVKRTIPQERLLALTGHADPAITELALRLLPRLALMTKEDADQFKTMLSETERKAAVEAQNDKLGREPAGPFMAAVRLEIVPTAASSSRSPRGQTARPQFMLLTCGKGTFETSRENEPRVVFDRKNLIADPTTRTGTSGRSSLAIDAAPLIRAALASEEAENEGLARRLDVSFLSDPIPCPVTYESLGTWMGTATIPTAAGSRDHTVTSPWRVNSVQVILETLAPQSTY